MGRHGPRVAPASSRRQCGKPPPSASESLGTFPCRNDTSGVILGLRSVLLIGNRGVRLARPWGTLRVISRQRQPCGGPDPLAPHLVLRCSGTLHQARQGEKGAPDPGESVHAWEGRHPP